MSIDKDHIITAWNIRLDRLPQLRQIALENSLDPIPLVTYEALYYIMAQWANTITRPSTPLTKDIIHINEISRSYLARHAQLFLDAPELPIQVVESIEPILSLTETKWQNAERVRSARSQLDKLISTAQTRFTHNPIFTRAEEYANSQESIINPIWNRFVKDKYGLGD